LTRARAGVRIVFAFVARFEDFGVDLPLSSVRFDAELDFDEMVDIEASIALVDIADGIEIAKKSEEILFDRWVDCDLPDSPRELKNISWLNLPHTLCSVNLPSRACSSAWENV